MSKETITKQKRIYSQNWPVYNKTQTIEKEHFLRLLRDLVDGVSAQPRLRQRGRPRMLISDAIFAACYKIYSTMSGRRFMTDLRAAYDEGYLSRSIHYNSIFNYLEKSSLTPILQDLIIQTSLPLKQVETDFAIDSSGFTASRFKRWHDHKYNDNKVKDWIKIHIICGIKTNIITSVQIKGRSTSDATQLISLFDKTSENFEIAELSGDKAYLSQKNINHIGNYGAVPFIPFKTTSIRKTNKTWAMMYHYFSLHNDEFMKHYHKRSNVESTFSMIKAKFGDSLRSKTDVAMRNETLCKIICHNICVLINESAQLGINIDFVQGRILPIN